MDVGILTFATERSLSITELARACETRRLESLWLPEHPVVPVEHTTRYPLAADGKLPRPYRELPDPFALLSAAAAVTTTLKLGTGICLVPERDPLLTAHQVATVDHLSGGRFLFGIGAGWLKEEMDLFTPHFEHRFGYMRESVAAMRQLWTGEPVAFKGKWIEFPQVLCRPAPAQRPHPPVLIGGMGPNVRKRVAEWGDGWMPIGLPPAELRAAREEIAALAREKGRDPKRLTYTIMIGALPGMEEPALEMLPGKDVLAAYGEAGADRVVVSVPTLARDGMLAHLDRVAAAAA